MKLLRNITIAVVVAAVVASVGYALDHPSPAAADTGSVPDSSPSTSAFATARSRSRR